MSVTKERWQEAQEWESQLWQGMSADIPSLLGIPSDYVLLQRRIGADLMQTLLTDKDVLEIGVGPFGISLTSLYLGKSRIKRLVKVEPLPRIRLTDLQGEERSLIEPLIHWLHDLSEEGEYVQAPGEALGYEAEFDTVITANVLDHVYEPEKILRNAYRALRPGGQILVAVNCFSLLGYLKFEYITRNTMKGSILVDSHPHTFLPPHVKQMMERCGFRRITGRGLPKTWWDWLAGSNATTSMPMFIGYK